MTLTDAILGRRKEFKVLVGFLGTTGVGKTTLLKYVRSLAISTLANDLQRTNRYL
jgi:ABC-type nitrate/sulfonate/bicarbonate transport system ATPase subunit